MSKAAKADAQCSKCGSRNFHIEHRGTWLTNAINIVLTPLLGYVGWNVEVCVCDRCGFEVEE